MAETVPHGQHLGRIIPGMAVRDVTGEQVGSIVHVYRHVEEQRTAQDVVVHHAADPIIEVRAGFLGLGEHLYIPMSAVQDVRTDSVFLTAPHESFRQLGYETRPDHLSLLG